MQSRVRIGSCRDAGEAAVIRAVLTAHQIPVFISGENHATMLGLGMSAIEQVIWVDAEDADDAAELLHEIRVGGAAILPDDEIPDDDDSERDDEVEPGGAVIVSSDYGLSKVAARKRIALALLVGVVVGFGTAHMSIRSWRTAIALAIGELAGWILVVTGGAQAGGWLIACAIVADVGLAIMKISEKTSSIAPAVALKKE